MPEKTMQADSDHLHGHSMIPGNLAEGCTGKIPLPYIREFDIIEMKVMGGPPCPGGKGRPASEASESGNPFMLSRIIVTVKTVPSGFLRQPVRVVPDAFPVGTMIDERYRL